MDLFHVIQVEARYKYRKPNAALPRSCMVAETNHQPPVLPASIVQGSIDTPSYKLDGLRVEHAERGDSKWIVSALMYFTSRQSSFAANVTLPISVSEGSTEQRAKDWLCHNWSLDRVTNCDDCLEAEDMNLSTDSTKASRYAMWSAFVQTRKSSTKGASLITVDCPSSEDSSLKRDSAGIFNGSRYTSAGAFASRHIALSRQACTLPDPRPLHHQPC